MNYTEMVDFLNKNPDASLKTMDDRKCEAFFSALGMTNHFVRSDTPNMCVLSSSSHETHWVVGACWSGYPDAHENGYALFFLPKTQASEEDLKNFVEFVVTTNGGHDIQRITWSSADDTPRG